MLRRLFWVVAGCVLVAAGLIAAATYFFSGVSLAADKTALARVGLEPLAGSLESVRASAPDGTSIPLAVRGGVLTPTKRLAPGEQVTVAVLVRRPGWASWALGSERRERLTIRTPVAHVEQRWLTVERGHRPVVRFDIPVSTVSVGRSSSAVHSAAIPIPSTAVGGSTTVAAAPRPWEQLGARVRVTWFPKTRRPAVLVSPTPLTRMNPLGPLRLTFSQPVASLLHDRYPSFTPALPGRWVPEDDHTLVYRPSGYGARLNSEQTLRLPLAVTVVGGSPAARSLSWRVAPASFVRLQQLLAQEGYLPLAWSPTGTDVSRTPRAELAAATAPPPGRFEWQYPNTPNELMSLWRTGEPNEITRGAVMTFEHDHGLAVDGIAGSQVWRAAIEDAVRGRRKPGGYSYVFVHRNVPQLMTLWHNGQVVLTSPGNTGVPAAPTQVGTWPVFEHIPVGRMSGTNPDGSHYDDPGIRWISYFHGGEALHAFNRASFGTPQSLGCVELPLAAAAQVWPYTPIGTLVTIED
ncbi:MAG TPA: L,D-transpeptidase family protein [Gaiellaceae bacterium]|nr:L,D-transpeptidase family protein [Gaiellaceae bacterium]